VAGGLVLLAVGGAAYGAVKLTQQDTQRIEEHTGESVEELSEEDLIAAMEELGIQSIELTDDDQAIIADEGSAPSTTASSASPAAAASAEESYLDELERLANLRDQGVISDEEFEAKKKQLLGL
jgi:hypothetical protein